MPAIGELKQRKDIIISRPDKGEGVVIIDRIEYETKMMGILSKDKNIERIGPCPDCNQWTLQRERSLQAFCSEPTSKNMYPRRHTKESDEWVVANQ